MLRDLLSLILIGSAHVIIACGASAAPTFDAAHAWAVDASDGELVAALADDDVRWNAIEAMRELRDRGVDAIRELEKALGSSDRQQRQLAASLLREIDAYLPTDEMLYVCVEGLANDRARPVRGAFPSMFGPNATEGTLYLIRHIDRAEGYVAAGMHFQDAQQRFFCAYILGMTSRAGYAEKICELLAPHLNDNSIRGDAVLATRALYLAGHGVIPHLKRAARSADDQGRSLIELIILDLQDPPAKVEDLYERGTMSDVTELVHDPAYEDVNIHRVIPFVGTYARE